MAHYVPCERKDTILVEVSLTKQLQIGTFEHTVDHLLDHKIDLSIFDHHYKNDHAGRPAWHPKVMLKIILVGYSRGLISSRDIATACEENIVFMALAGEAKPDFTTIARFVSSMAKEAEDVFCKVLMYCDEVGLIGGEMLAVDGHKIPSNAAKEWSGRHDELRKKAAKFRDIIAGLLARHRGADQSLDPPEQKFMKKMQRGVEKIDAFLAENEKRIGNSGKEVKSNITDNESAKMPSSHGMIQGYNAVAVVDAQNQVIVHAEAFGSGQEHSLLKPMLDGTRQNLIAIGNESTCMDGIKVLADTNYFSGDNCKLIDDQKIDALIPDPHYRKRDPRFINAKHHKPQDESNRKYGEQDFEYQPERDRWICPAGKELRLVHRAKKVNGFVLKEWGSRESDCAYCPLRPRCLQRKNGKRRYLVIVTSKTEDAEHIRRMKEKIDSPEGRAIYSKRMAIIEPVFGNIRANKKLNKFTLRGKTKVCIQWLLYAVVHNIEKISHTDYVRLQPG